MGACDSPSSWLLHSSVSYLDGTMQTTGRSLQEFIEEACLHLESFKLEPDTTVIVTNGP